MLGHLVSLGFGENLSGETMLRRMDFNIFVIQNCLCFAEIYMSLALDEQALRLQYLQYQ
jgi:hypothetical protein